MTRLLCLVGAAGLIALAQVACPPRASARQARAAEKFAGEPVFTFSARAVEGLVADPNGPELAAKPDLKLRPNTAAELFLYVKSPTNDATAFIVELRHGAAVSQAKVTLDNKGKWTLVKFPKPAPPVAPPAAPVVAATVAPPAIPLPLPPGREVVRVDGAHTVTVRLLAADGKTAVPSQGVDRGKPLGLKVNVEQLAASSYTKSPETTVTRTGGEGGMLSVTARVAADAAFGADPAAVRLSFPAAGRGAKSVVRKGVYERTLTAGATVALTGAVSNRDEPVRFALGVDGVERAYLYTVAPAGDRNNSKAELDATLAVRVAPVAGPAAGGAATQPVARFAVRVEVDNAPADARVELQLRAKGAGDSPEANETLALDGPRDERVWLDVAGPTEGLYLTAQSRDWVKDLDVSRLRGTVEVVARVTPRRAGGPAATTAKGQFELTIDDTPPDAVRFEGIPGQLIKGKPLRVKVRATDAETAIDKVVVYLGKAGDDGKMPADAVPIVARRVASEATLWEADVPLPADKKGPLTLTAVATNAAGLSASEPREIRLVDPPKPLGKIVGKVVYGGRPQPGLAVTLKDPEGKEKVAKTDEEGKFSFPDLPPGKYLLSAARKDSGVGSKGSVEVQVEYDEALKPDEQKPTRATVTLTRMP